MNDDWMYDSDPTQNAASKAVLTFIKDHEDAGKMAIVSLSRALGMSLVMATVPDQRDMALSVVVRELCQAFALSLEFEDESNEAS